MRRRYAVAVALGLVASVGCTGKYIRPTTDAKVELTPERVTRGEYLVKQVAACGACHDGRQSSNLMDPADPALHLAGGNYLEDADIKVWIPNITNDVETGIGGWSDDELIRGIRDGVRPDGSFMFPAMPFETYQHISDEDVKAIVAYLRSAPSVKLTKQKGENKVPFPIGMALGMGVAMHEPVKSVPEPDRSDKLKYGEYLGNVAHCQACHSMGGTGMRKKDDRYMGGGEMAMQAPGIGKIWPSNLTPHQTAGLGKYDAEQIKLALRSGMRLDGKRMGPPMSLMIPYFAMMEEQDLDAMVAWLKSLPPVDHKVPARELTAEGKKLLGE